MSVRLGPPPGGPHPEPSCHPEPLELGSCLSWHQTQQTEKAASLKNRDALKTGLLGVLSHRQDAHLGPHQLSLPPLLFCSEAVAFVRFPASRFRTLSRVCELSRICKQRPQPVNTLPPIRKWPWPGALLPSEYSPKPTAHTLGSQAQVGSGSCCCSVWRQRHSDKAPTVGPRPRCRSTGAYGLSRRPRGSTRHPSPTLR